MNGRNSIEYMKKSLSLGINVENQDAAPMSNSSLSTPRRKHRRVRSSNGRLSGKNSFNVDADDIEEAVCNYDIPHLQLSGLDQDSLFSDFAKERVTQHADKMLLTTTPTSLNKRTVSRTFSMRLERGMQSPSKKSDYKMNRTQTLLANFRYDIDEDRLKEDDCTKSIDSSSFSPTSKEDSSKLSLFPEYQENDSETVTVTSDQDGCIEITQNEIITETIKEENVQEDKHDDSENLESPMKRSTLLRKLRPSWLRRGKSDPSADKKSSDSNDLESRRKLIIRLRNDRQKYLGNDRNDITKVPLVVSSFNDDNEDVSTQSSHSESFTNQQRTAGARNCFTSMLGPNPKDVEMEAHHRNCFTSMFDPHLKDVETEEQHHNCFSGMLGLKPNETGNHYDCFSSLGGSKSLELPSTEKTEAKKVQISVGAPKVKITVTPRRKRRTPKSHKKSISLSIPSEPFTPNGRNVPDSITTSADDENSVVSNTSAFSFNSHFSQAFPSTPSRTLATTPKFNVLQVEQSAEKFMTPENDHGYGSDCNSTCSYSSVVSNSTSSSVYTDGSSIRDPCARKSRTVQRCKKLRHVSSDGDVWIEKVYVSKKTGKKRTYFVSVKTGERFRDEPPSGAAHVLYAADLLHRRKENDHSGQETIILCSDGKTSNEI